MNKQSPAEALGMTEAQWQEKLDASHHEMQLADLQQAEDLIDAGWKFELPEIVNYEHKWCTCGKCDSEIFQWYWRRPPIGKRKQGRRYLSTTQAWNALKREQHPIHLDPINF